MIGSLALNERRSRVRILVGALAVPAAGALAWIVSLPNKEECRASGRTVDPTERHCTSATGYQQLQEHATFHASQVVVLALVVVTGAYIVYRLTRRWWRRVAPAA
jgi:hypothetical protein